MPELYPFLLVPDLREVFWWTRDVAPVDSRVADSELIRAVRLAGGCKIVNGPFSGVTSKAKCRIGQIAMWRDRFGHTSPGTLVGDFQ